MPSDRTDTQPICSPLTFFFPFLLLVLVLSSRFCSCSLDVQRLGSRCVGARPKKDSCRLIALLSCLHSVSLSRACSVLWLLSELLLSSSRHCLRFIQSFPCSLSLCLCLHSPLSQSFFRSFTASSPSSVLLSLQVTRLQNSRLIQTMESAISLGFSVMIENLDETIEAVLAPVVGRQTIRRGRSQYIKLGDKEINYNPNFRLFLQTPLSNPHYPPEIQAECTIINFTVTQKVGENTRSKTRDKESFSTFFSSPSSSFLLSFF